MKTFILLALVGVALAGIELRGSVDGLYSSRSDSEKEVMFKHFQLKYKKAYSTAEEFNTRFGHFKAALERIDARNKQAGPDGAKFGITKFSDMSPEEFKAFNGYQPSPIRSFAPVMDKLPVSSASFDWSKKGATTAVKDQGQCGSCWAFSATEGVESGYFMAKGKLHTLAPQQIVSCDEVDQACNGGDLPSAFAYVKKNGMIPESANPYKSGWTGSRGKCEYKKSEVVVDITGFQYATKDKDEDQMLSVSEKHGPLSICVDAETWQDYESGIIKSDCGTELDHCVQLVGAGSESGTDYWKVRNSWNTDWGEDGYIRIARGKNLCGVAEEATFVTV